MRGARDADVHQVAGPVLVRVARVVDVDHDDVIELEALHARHIGDVDARLEVELVAAHAAQRGDLGAAEAVEVRVRLLGVARDHGARRGRLARHQVAQRIAEERDRLAQIAELVELDGLARARGERLRRRQLGSEDLAREQHDLGRRAVRQLERAHDRGLPGLLEQLFPSREVVVEHQALRGVAGDGHRALRRIAVGSAHGLDEHLDLERGAILRLVDRDVLVEQLLAFGRVQAAALELHEAEQDRIVLVVEPPCRIVLVGADRDSLGVEHGVALLVDGRLLRLRELAAHPLGDLRDVALRDIAAREPGGERRGIREQLGPVLDHIVGALLPALDHALQRDAHVALQGLRVLLEPRIEARQPRHERALDQAVPLVDGGRVDRDDVRGDLCCLLRDVVDEQGEQRWVLLDARDVLRRIVVVLGRRVRKAAHARRARPARVRHDRHSAHAERRQYARDVAHERLRRHDEQRVLRAEPLAVLEVQERDAVQRDRGLAAARAALDHDDAAARLRDQLELLLVDQRRDLGERLVSAHRAVVHAELALRAAGRDRARGLAHAAVEHGRELTDRLHPAAARVLEERALRRADAAEVAARDRDVPPRVDDAVHAAAGDLFLVVVALFVAIVDARDGRVAPVDDLHVRLAIDEAALADHHVARLALLLQAHVREVRARDVDRQLCATTDARLERREARHLLDQRR